MNIREHLRNLLVVERLPESRAKILAQLAIASGQLGDEEVALQSISEIRRLVDVDLGLASALANMAEGIVRYHQSDLSSAYRLLDRSRVISELAGRAELIAWSRTWCALVDFNELRFDSALAHLDAAVDNGAFVWPSVSARAALVVAGMLQFLSESTVCRKWYAMARQHALRDHDEATMNAALYNDASFRLMKLKLRAVCSGGLDLSEAALVRASIASAENFDAAVGSVSMPWAFSLMRAQLACVTGDYLGARRLFSEWFGALPSDFSDRHAPYLLADDVWCAVNLDQNYDIDEWIESLENLDEGTLAPDDLAVTYMRAAQVLQLKGLDAQAARMRARSTMWMNAHQVICDTYAEQLGARYGLIGDGSKSESQAREDGQR